MAEVVEHEREETEDEERDERANGGEGLGKGTAVKAAAAVAAAGAAAVATRKVLSKRSPEEGSEASSTKKPEGSNAKSGTGLMLRSVAEGGWDAARDALVPVAEDAADAAGAYLANNGPEVVRDRIVPRFISSFSKAREKS
jgi:hypothetical protein